MSDQDDSIIIQVSRRKSNSLLLSIDIANNKGGCPNGTTLAAKYESKHRLEKALDEIAVHFCVLKYDFQKEHGVQ
eukprot:13910050-Ditylum_brightwellii.AAC.1